MSDSEINHSSPLRIDSTHPALAGHFPGNPVVPGVVLLDRVQQAVQRWLGRPAALTALPQVKFIAPLLPDQQADIELKLKGTQLRFSIERDGEKIAQGVMTLADPAS